MSALLAIITRKYAQTWHVTCADIQAINHTNVPFVRTRQRQTKISFITSKPTRERNHSNVRIVHLPGELIQCKHCSKFLENNIARLMFHCATCVFLQSHNCQYVCFACTYSTQVNAHMQKHIRLHLTAQKCKLCDFSTYHEEQFEMHMQIKHQVANMKKPSHHCNLCIHKYYSSYALKRHMKDVHKEDY
ncbi:hypothetical protein M8J76_001980 [Diaphorina citri]|nr:hypothetical protein M8J76_001980 [Diaphorina citri]KAI5721527.1 hypothetical protein M8J77_021859 [Diaphorina citri]